MLRIKNLTARYDSAPVLTDLSLEAGPGQVIGIIGRNGAGKTTTFRCILNQMPQRDGSIRFNDVDLTRVAPNRIPSLGIAFVPQGRGTFEELTVGENLSLVRVPKQEARARLDAATKKFPLLLERWNQPAGTLSGGEARMVSLARAMMLAPKLVLLDEPTVNLSESRLATLTGLVGEWRSRGAAILMIEHNLDFLFATADRVYVIDRGEVAFQGLAEDLRRNGKAELKKLFGLDQPQSQSKLVSSTYEN